MAEQTDRIESRDARIETLDCGGILRNFMSRPAREIVRFSGTERRVSIRGQIHLTRADCDHRM
jgi:hypothetical protein